MILQVELAALVDPLVPSPAVLVDPLVHITNIGGEVYVGPPAACKSCNNFSRSPADPAVDVPSP